MTTRFASKTDRLMQHCHFLRCRRYPCVYTGEVSQKEVTAVFSHEVDHINYLTVLDEFGNEKVIATTDSHPFWVVTDEPDLERAAREYVEGWHHENIAPGLTGFWVEAKDLREGDVFLGANGELSTLLSKERIEFEDGITVYNFTVDGNHNYFVVVEVDEFGQICVLVHNAGDGDDPPTGGGQFFPNFQFLPPGVSAGGAPRFNSGALGDTAKELFGDYRHLTIRKAVDGTGRLLGEVPPNLEGGDFYLKFDLEKMRIPWLDGNTNANPFLDTLNKGKKGVTGRIDGGSDIDGGRKKLGITFEKKY